MHETLVDAGLVLCVTGMCYYLNNKIAKQHLLASIAILVSDFFDEMGILSFKDLCSVNKFLGIRVVLHEDIYFARSRIGDRGIT